ncbi:conserved exported protein of unknown function(LTXXQ motif family protein,52-146) [Magnetospirillum sp. XM-1]|uniref:Spy/CpxP family protein refolding chaperone n=1 Tax=Magnetospirillum sp. XM-1 TaxID=1663591 RepID=UPI00073DEDD2|nr:Spy/CpxP family protein refolding chaperone [Magnetospirillum sp. XM-1]CUW38240.1 conserved exported protein of unknown function(LTXXQ motif family protein,52-146) [Magnetospirillum sp. XM-1]
MSRITLITASVAIVLGLAALVNVARAADPAAGPKAANFERMSRMCYDMEARMAARMAYNEVKLKLTETQKAEFKRLGETMKEAAVPMRQMCEDKADPAKLATLPERMDRMQKVAEARAESMRKMVPAMKDFYASLSLEQQKVADEVMGGMGGKGGFGHGRHGGMMMHH